VNLIKNIDIAQYDLIMSRGGTLERLRKVVDLPTIEISISVYDVLRTIKLAEHYTQKFAVIGYASITEAAKTLCDLLKYDIDIYTLDSSTNVEEAMVGLKSQGYGMVLSDVIGFQSAKSVGLNAILITSGAESIENALQRAKELFFNISELVLEKKLLQNVLGQLGQTIFIHDFQGILIYSHVREEHRTIIDPLSSVITPSDPSRQTQQIEEFTFQKIQVKVQRLLTHQGSKEYRVTTLQTWPLLKDQLKGLTVINHLYEDQTPFEGFDHISYVGNTDEELIKYAKPMNPIIVIGEQGTGKDKAAHTIYSQGIWAHHPLYQIDMRAMREKTWNHLVDHTESPFFSMDNTIHFKNLHQASPDQLNALRHLIQNSVLIERNKVIFSSVPIEASYTDGFLKDLCYLHSAMTVSLEPLRNRVEEIPNIASLYINLYNAQFGKEIVGFETDALKALQSYSWPDNLDEMKTALRECVLLSEKPYITRAMVEKVIHKQTTQIQVERQEGFIALDARKPLNEITADLITYVLKEENQNQQRTAARLGISRSTLWRMLKNK